MKTLIVAVLLFIAVPTFAQLPFPGARPIQTLGFISNGLGFVAKGSALLTNGGGGSDQTQWATIACAAIGNNYFKEKHSIHSQEVGGAKIKRFSFTHQLELEELSPPPAGVEIICTLYAGFITENPYNINGVTSQVFFTVSNLL